MAVSIQELVAETLTGLGLPTPNNVIRTMLMKDRYFVGQKLRYDGGYAILKAGAIATECVPEPSAIVLLGVGVLGLLAWAWCRRRS